MEQKHLVIILVIVQIVTLAGYSSIYRRGISENKAQLEEYCTRLEALLNETIDGQYVEQQSASIQLEELLAANDSTCAPADPSDPKNVEIKIAGAEAIIPESIDVGGTSLLEVQVSIPELVNLADISVEPVLCDPDDCETFNEPVINYYQTYKYITYETVEQEPSLEVPEANKETTEENKEIEENDHPSEEASTEETEEEEGSEHQCTFAEIPSEEYIFLAASCRNGTVYFKSCETCGKAGNETFEADDKKEHALNNFGVCVNCGDSFAVTLENGTENEASLTLSAGTKAVYKLDLDFAPLFLDITSAEGALRNDVTVSFYDEYGVPLSVLEAPKWSFTSEESILFGTFYVVFESAKEVTLTFTLI